MARIMTQRGDFLWTGKKAEVGQLLELRVFDTDRQMAKLFALVTSVGDLPNFDQWATSGASFFPLGPCEHNPDPYRYHRPDTEIPYGCNCTHPDCDRAQIASQPGIHTSTLTLGTLYDRVLDHLGTLHGQKLTAYGVRSFSEQHSLAFGSGRIYKFNLEVDDRLQNVWSVKSIEDVSSWPAERLPRMVREWDCLRAGEYVAPFDLSDEERADWLVQHEMDWKEKLVEEFDDELLTKALEEEDDEEDSY